eukprot:COSAG01_NODE_68022_length_265_cov_0.771084_1_plen_77_part_10
MARMRARAEAEAEAKKFIAEVEEDEDVFGDEVDLLEGATDALELRIGGHPDYMFNGVFTAVDTVESASPPAADDDEE